MQALESTHINLGEAPALPFPLIPAWVDYGAKFAKFLELPKKVLRGKATLQSVFPPHALAELQRAKAATPSGDRHVLAESSSYG
jgi:hypothetical protein